MTNIASTILQQLTNNEEYTRKVLPHIKPEYFDLAEEKQIYQLVSQYFSKYNSVPSIQALQIELDNQQLSQQLYDNSKNIIQNISSNIDNKVDLQWLIDKTEQFCKDRALYIALSEAIVISQSEDVTNQITKTAIPELLSKALSVSFDSNVGHDYIEDAENRFAEYQTKRAKIKFHLDMMNIITDGGVERKTLNTLVAGTGCGKSLVMCDFAANYMKNGYNVLYITMEMAEEKIAERIDANLMSINMEDLKKTSTEMLHVKLNDIKTKTVGKLKIKEYPTGAPHVGHFRFLLKELKSKQNFVPDIIFVDYIGICASSKMKDKSNSYNYIKSVYEEVRGFAIENNVVVWTANQSNREGNNNTDADITNVADSMGGPMTSDILLMLISNEDLASMNQILVKQLKNRYADVFKYNKFNIGIDRAKMRLYDLNNNSTYSQPKAPVIGGNKSTTNNNRFSGLKA